MFIRGREDCQIEAVASEDIEAWLAQYKVPSSRKSYFLRVSVLFSFAKRRGWIPENPCCRIEAITFEVKAPVILHVEQCERLLALAGPGLRPWAVLCLLAGLRPCEAQRLDWEAVRLGGENPHVVVSAAASKVRLRRIVPLQSNACAWLALDARESGAIVQCYGALRRTRSEAAGALGLVWTPDVLRHTYASMRIAAGAHAGDVAAEMGNSPGVLLTHYRELVSREEAARFWELRP